MMNWLLPVGEESVAPKVTLFRFWQHFKLQCALVKIIWRVLEMSRKCSLFYFIESEFSMSPKTETGSVSDPESEHKNFIISRIRMPIARQWDDLSGAWKSRRQNDRRSTVCHGLWKNNSFVIRKRNNNLRAKLHHKSWGRFWETRWFELDRFARLRQQGIRKASKEDSQLGQISTSQKDKAWTHSTCPNSKQLSREEKKV